MKEIFQMQRLKAKIVWPEGVDRRIPTEWVQGMTTEEAAKFEQAWKSKGSVINKLKELIEQRFHAEVTGLSVDYSSPTWQVSQTRAHAKQELLQELYKLLP
jgi:hypothetical protein